MVFSNHHQAIKEIGKDFVVTATSIDGKVIEALAHRRYKNVIGVQFHPEIYYLYAPEEKKYKRTPNDHEILTVYQILKNQNSLQFHQKFWEHFSRLFR